VPGPAQGARPAAVEDDQHIARLERDFAVLGKRLPSREILGRGRRPNEPREWRRTRPSCLTREGWQRRCAAPCAILTPEQSDLPDLLHEYDTRNLQGRHHPCARRYLLELGQRGQVPGFEPLPKINQLLPQFRGHAWLGLPHLDRRGPAAEHDPAHRPKHVQSRLDLHFIADESRRLERLVRGLESRRCVHAVSERGILDPALAAEIADHRFPTMKTDPGAADRR
jgi:hypothetical protein